MISIAICFVSLWFLLKANPNANGLSMKQQFYNTVHTASKNAVVDENLKKIANAAKKGYNQVKNRFTSTQNEHDY